MSSIDAVFRFAPSPNGELHLGHAYSALMNHALARASGGRFLLRHEDIDTARCTPALERQGAPPFEEGHYYCKLRRNPKVSVPFDRQVSFERQTSGRHVVALSKHVVSPLAPQHDVPPLRGLR